MVASGTGPSTIALPAERKVGRPVAAEYKNWRARPALLELAEQKRLPKGLAL